MKQDDLEVPFDIGMLVMKHKQLVVIISNEPKDERLADIINKNDDYYAFFVKDMGEYENLVKGFEKHKRTFMPIIIPHQMKAHQKSLIDFMQLANNLPINIPLHVADARTVEDAFDTSLLEEMRRGYGGDYMNLMDFSRPESRSAAKSLLPQLRNVPESAQFGVMTIGGQQYAINPRISDHSVSSQEHSIGGDVYDRNGLIRRQSLQHDVTRFGEGMKMITAPIRSDVHLADFTGHRNLTTACLSYQTFGGDWSYPHRKKNKPPVAAKVRGMNNNGVPTKKGKDRWPQKK